MCVSSRSDLPAAGAETTSNANVAAVDQNGPALVCLYFLSPSFYCHKRRNVNVNQPTAQHTTKNQPQHTTPTKNDGLRTRTPFLYNNSHPSIAAWVPERTGPSLPRPQYFEKLVPPHKHEEKEKVPSKGGEIYDETRTTLGNRKLLRV